MSGRKTKRAAKTTTPAPDSEWILIASGSGPGWNASTSMPRKLALAASELGVACQRSLKALEGLRLSMLDPDTASDVAMARALTADALTKAGLR